MHSLNLQPFLSFFNWLRKMVIYTNYLYCLTSSEFFKSDLFLTILQKLFWSSTLLICLWYFTWLNTPQVYLLFFSGFMLLCEAKDTNQGSTFFALHREGATFLFYEFGRRNRVCFPNYRK